MFGFFNSICNLAFHWQRKTVGAKPVLGLCSYSKTDDAVLVSVGDTDWGAYTADIYSSPSCRLEVLQNAWRSRH